jgi:hypothetical protein
MQAYEEVEVQLLADGDDGTVVSCTHWPIYPQAKSTHYPLNIRTDGSQSQSGCSGKEKILWPVLSS